VSFARWTRPMFKHDLPSRVDEAADAAKRAQATERSVYAAVTKREANRCRVCGAYCAPEAVGLLKRGHHHHIVYRSAGGETSASNVILLCALCHDGEHKHKLRIEGDGDEAPWLTIHRRDGERWYVWRQETGVRTYVDVD